MQDVRKTDPTFTNFLAKTAVEAVDRYVRCRRNGLKPMLVPECLIQCARGLKGSELDKFEAWIIDPNGIGSVDPKRLVPDSSICDANEKVFQETLKRIEEQVDQEDEKVAQSSDDEYVSDDMGLELYITRAD